MIKGSFTIIVLSLLLSSISLPQVNEITQRYRDDQKGSYTNRHQGILDGNNIRTIFINNGEVGQWPYKPSAEWPKGTGNSYLDGLCILIAAEVTAPGISQIVHPLETSYREWMDSDPVSGIRWGLEPVPGYCSGNNIANSVDIQSWPATWPAALGLDPSWDGNWYGYFGKGIRNADLESFFVMDDSKDGEFKRVPYSYYPITSDSSRGGLGLRVETRSFQYSVQTVEDVLFWHYDIINISDYTYNNAVFGFYADGGVGGPNDSRDDNASFNKDLDLSYFFDADGLGETGYKTGYFGIALLESPGNALNGIDDDNDGIIDERRDDGIDNDHDWIGFTDMNGNGKWDSGEPLNDDLGMDGIGPDNSYYSGPDQGEGDGTPSSGEPNFDMTDKDESDQIGLTAISIYRLGEGGTGGGWPKDDESMWLKLTGGTFDTSIQNANISMTFGSGPFPLLKERREKISSALIFGDDLTDLIFNKNSAQSVYNNNYRFPDSLFSDANDIIQTPENFSLFQNYPNPFNPATVISYNIDKPGLVSLKIYDALGTEVFSLVNEEQTKGNHEVHFDGRNLSSGIYFAKLVTKEKVNVIKMLLMK